LDVLRQEMDAADTALLEIIHRRSEIASKIGQYKKNHNMTILQLNRWQTLLEDRLTQARRLGIDESLVKDIYQILHQRSIKIQGELLNK